MKTASWYIVLALSAVVMTPSARASDDGLSLKDAVQIALARDPWLEGSQFREKALSDEAIAAGELPDPQISLKAANLPFGSVDLNQEPMTQLSVGLSQAFPQGHSRTLAKRQKQILAAQQPLMRFDRKARVTATVNQLWLEVYRTEESIRLIENDRTLFEQLADAADASYSAALGRTRQQDIIRAQLELTRLEDRLTQLRQQRDAARQTLSEWIGSQAGRDLSLIPPDLKPAMHGFDEPVGDVADWQIYDWLRLHPAVLALDRSIDTSDTAIDLARQKYKPAWGVSAQYSYRAEDQLGRSRADLLSLGVNFSVPLFTANRQDREVAAAKARSQAARTDKELLIRQLMAQIETARAQLKRLDERRALYHLQLLPQMSEQADASLAAYNNDDGDFAEAVRARISELNAKIDALTIDIDRQKTIAQINYVLTRSPSDESASQDYTGTEHD